MSVVRPLALGLLAALLLPAVPPAEAFDIFASPATRRTLNLNLGTTQFQTLGYGVKSWNELAEDAMNVWNDAGVGGTPDHGFFQVSTGGSADPCVRDGVNEVRFAATLCGFSWGSIVAVAITRFDNKDRGVETDVIFNNTIAIDAYPGSLRSTIDFVRVAIHEFGHTMGLDHPDEAGQSVSAIMNAFISNIDTIQADDSAGARAIAWDAPPTAHVEDFVRGFYRNILGRRGHEAEVAAWVAYLLTNPNAVPAAFGMAHGFLESGEHLATATTHAAYVGRLYATILGRTPTAAETGAWVGVIADRFNQVLPGFINSPEFQSLLATPSSATIITRFYQETLGRSPSASELAAWESVVASTGDWSAVARGFLNSAEYLAGSRTVAGHVTVLYRTFLGRTPSTAEAAGWVGALVAQLSALEDTFLASNEFRTRARVLFR